MKRDIFFLAFYCLLAAGAAAADSLPAPAYPGMVLIPAGEFVLGFDANTPAPEFLSDRTTSSNAQPKQKINLEEFFIDRLEVTYGEFLRFKPQAEYAQGRLDQPIRGISWFEAEAYCFWVSKRLPTEMEWEKAARGADGRLFVWGNQFLRDKANFSKKVRKTGTTETDKSVFGVYDMNGNVSEWTSSWYLPYPGSTHQDPSFGRKLKVIRGGAIQKRDHGFLIQFAMLPFRNVAPPQMRSWDTGFRCAHS